ncbi:MAG: hypothetical protein EOR07_10875 [Mesorhizobium sp.]|nr:MAG: hypothetical protein EOR07_10875 [Mesorhizobium sp.]
MTSRNCPWRPNRVEAIAQVGAAPHLAAAIFSPYSDGEKDAFAKDFANIQRAKRVRGCGQPLLPVTIRGEVPGRR